ncbi:MAG: hypothetical protein HYV63_01100 [Candidatus Schekmanbacteria bacterium]|nr:hypothetical protein [Candidatus Schekmanbacteria bacterium]
MNGKESLRGRFSRIVRIAGAVSLAAIAVACAARAGTGSPPTAAPAAPQRDFEVSAVILAPDILGDGSLAPKDRTRFGSRDPQVVCWLRAAPVTRAHTVSWKWYEPSGSLYAESAPLAVSASGAARDWAAVWHSLAVSGERASAIPGDWQVVVLVDGAVAAQKAFNLQVQP